MVKGAVTTWHMTHHMTRHVTRHMTRHVTRPRVARPRGGGRVAVAVWRWPCSGGRVAVAVWRWPCGGHMTCHVTWQDNPLRVTSNMAAYSEDSLESFRLTLHLSRGNRRLITPYILLFSLLLIISYLGGLVIRGVNALIIANHLNRFSNSSPSLIRVARDWHVLWPDLSLALASLYPDSARDPAGDLWRYFITLPPFLGYWSLNSAQSILRV